MVIGSDLSGKFERKQSLSDAATFSLVNSGIGTPDTRRLATSQYFSEMSMPKYFLQSILAASSGCLPLLVRPWRFPSVSW